MPQRRDYIDELKGLGILLVVLGHFIEQYRMGYSFVSASFFCIYAFHMALFCICSGLVARFNPRKLVTQQLWLYLVGQTLMLAFRAAVLRENFAETDGLLAAWLLPWRHIWYLYALIFWHLTLPVLCRLRDRLGLAGSCLGMALAVGLALTAGLVDWPFTLVRVFAFYPFYAAVAGLYDPGAGAGGALPPSAQTVLNELQAVVTPEETAYVRTAYREVKVSEEVKHYLMDIVEATRTQSGFVSGVSTRGALALYQAAQAYASLQGREYVIPEDIKGLAPAVLSHRISLGSSMNAEAAALRMRKLLAEITVPLESAE